MLKGGWEYRVPPCSISVVVIAVVLVLTNSQLQWGFHGGSFARAYFFED